MLKCNHAMTISALIATLEDVKKDHGDLIVYGQVSDTKYCRVEGVVVEDNDTKIFEQCFGVKACYIATNQDHTVLK